MNNGNSDWNDNDGLNGTDDGLGDDNFGNNFGGGSVDHVIEIGDLNMKRYKFSYFLRSLYDTFWYENSVL